MLQEQGRSCFYPRNNSGEGTEPADWVEGEDLAATLEPQSLYEDQLARRLASP